MFPDRTRCPPTEMKDYSPQRLPSEGGRLNEDLLVGQWSRSADEKLCRLTRKPARLDDEKPGPRAEPANWAISCVCACANSCGHHCLTGSDNNDALDLIRSDQKWIQLLEC